LHSIWNSTRTICGESVESASDEEVRISIAEQECLEMLLKMESDGADVTSRGRSFLMLPETGKARLLTVLRLNCRYCPEE